MSSVYRGGLRMKKAYSTPKAKMIDYSFEDQVIAQSYPISSFADPWKGRVCTWGDGGCSMIYNVMARGLGDCDAPGNPDLLNPYEDCY